MISKLTIGVSVILASMLLFGCNSDDSTNTDTDTITNTNTYTDTDTDSNSNTSNTNPNTLISKYTPDEGRLLASQCSQCHGTNGISTNRWDSIAGEGNLHNEMFEDDAPIMLAQAKGYTNAEISMIENYLTQFPEARENGNDNDNDDNDNDDDDHKNENDDD